ncbi:MAG: hypothetical protein ACPG19_07325 [Saprospiraceae bacterium]
MNKISILFFVSFIILVLGCKNEKVTNENPTDNKITEKDTAQVKSKINQNELIKKVEDYTASNTEGEVITPKSTPKKWMIVPGTRVGEIKKNSSLKSLEATYGKKNIVIEGVVTLGRSPEGNLIKGIKTKIFRGRDNEIEVVWSDTANIKNPVVVRVLGTEKGDWITNSNVKIGTPLDYLIILNTKDFYFLGFDEETYEGQYNGIVTWDKGRLPNTFGLHLSPSLMSKTLPIFNNFKTLAKFPTNHPDVPSLGLSVGQMSFTFN